MTSPPWPESKEYHTEFTVPAPLPSGSSASHVPPSLVPLYVVPAMTRVAFHRLSLTGAQPLDKSGPVRPTGHAEHTVALL